MALYSLGLGHGIPLVRPFFLFQKMPCKVALPSPFLVSLSDTSFSFALLMSIPKDLPKKTSGHTATMIGDYMLVHGGREEGGAVQPALHCLDVGRSAWALLDDSGTIGPRYDHTACFIPALPAESATSFVVYFGGEGPGGALTNEVAVLELQHLVSTSTASFRHHWHKVEASGQVPSPRAGHAATLGANNAVYVFGGRTAAEDGSTTLSNALFSGRLSSAMDPAGGERTVEFRWEGVATHGPAPKPAEQCVLHAVDTKLILSHGWVGVEHGLFTDALWIIDVGREDKAWRKIALKHPAGFPAPGYGMGSVLHHWQAQPMGTVPVLYQTDEHGRFCGTFRRNEENQKTELTIGKVVSHTTNLPFPSLVVLLARFYTHLRAKISSWPHAATDPFW